MCRLLVVWDLDVGCWLKVVGGCVVDWSLLFDCDGVLVSWLMIKGWWMSFFWLCVSLVGGI